MANKLAFGITAQVQWDSAPPAGIMAVTVYLLF